MVVVAVGLDFEHARQVGLLQYVLEGVPDRDGIIAVNMEAGHAVGSGHVRELWRRAALLTRCCDGVVIVLDRVYDRCLP